MYGEQIRAARTMTGLTVAELAKLAGLSVPTVQRLDSAKGPVPGRHETVEALRRPLEAKGVQFLEGGQVAVGPGVALKGAGE